VDTDVAFGAKAVGDSLLGIAFEFDADADDAFFVAEKSFRFFLHEGFHGRGEVEVDAGDNQFVLMGGSVHMTHNSSVVGLTNGKVAGLPEP
jgi:hypothetical protein